jgi:hypothetical protein
MTKQPRKARQSGSGGQPARKALAEARAVTSARRSAAPIDANPVDTLQEVLDGYTQDLRFTQKMVDILDEDDLWRITYQRDLDGALVETGRMPNEWIRLRDDYRQQLAALAGSMIARGIAEKAVNVRAAQAALMATMVTEAMKRAGADAEMIARTGNELRQLAVEAIG